MNTGSRSRNRKRSKESQDVLERFFVAYNILKEAKEISAIEISERLGFDRSIIYRQKRFPTMHILDFDALQIIINLGVSAEWLLTGKGKMMK